MGRGTGNLAFRRELNDHEDRLVDIEKGGGLSAVNEPEEGQVLSVNGDGNFEWITPEGGGGTDVPRVIAAYVNGANGEILASYTNGLEGHVCERLDEGIFWFKYVNPFPEPVPGANAPPFVSVLALHPGGELEESVIATTNDQMGALDSGGALIELRKSDGTLVDANFFLTAIGPFA